MAAVVKNFKERLGVEVEYDQSTGKASLRSGNDYFIDRNTDVMVIKDAKPSFVEQ